MKIDFFKWQCKQSKNLEIYFNRKAMHHPQNYCAVEQKQKQTKTLLN